MQRAFSTEHAPPGHRLRWWQEALSEVYYNLEVYSPHQEGLFGQLTEYDIGGIGLSRFASEEQRVFRSRSRIAMDSDDSYVVVLPNNKTMFYSQAGRSGFRTAGKHVLVNTQEFYELSSPDAYSNLTVKFPGELLRQRFPCVDDHCAAAFEADPKLVRVFRDYAHWLFGQEEVPPAVADSLAEQLIDLLVAVLESERETEDESTSRAVAALRHRISRYLHDHLCDPELTPARLAEAFSISPSYLHRVFRPGGLPVGRWIATQRLQEAYEMLTVPRYQGRSIAEIAYAVGFASQSHFSEAFRRQFGATPSAVRAKARQAQASR